MIQQLDGKACIFPQISHKRCKMVWKHLILNQIASGSVNTLRQNKHKFTVETFGVIISAFRGILWLQCIPDSCTTMQCLNPAEDLCCVIFPSMLPCLMKGGKKAHKIILKMFCFSVSIHCGLYQRIFISATSLQPALYSFTLCKTS